MLKQLKLTIEEYHDNALEDRQILGEQLRVTRTALEHQASRPAVLVGGFGGGLLLGFFRCRQQAEPAAETAEQAERQSGSEIVSLVSWFLRHFGWAIATAWLEGRGHGEHAPPND